MTTDSLALSAPLTTEELERLRLTRLENGWSFLRMAELIGVPESTLRTVLTQKKRPTELTNYRIRQWLDKHWAETQNGGD